MLNDVPCDVADHLTIGERVRWMADYLHSNPLEMQSDVEVGVHAYDLSQGFIKKHKESFLRDLPEEERHVLDGVYHSGLVVFGMEYFFEGGIAVAAKGCTRFGTQFEYRYVGRSTRKMSEFMQWLRSVESEKYQMANYHPMNHNCHTFTREACDFLLGGSSSAYPMCLMSSLDSITRSACGSLILPVVVRFTGGVQKVVLDQLLHHDEERNVCKRVVRRVAELSHLPLGAMPPRCVFLFSPPAAHAAAAIVRLGSLHYPEAGAKLTCNDRLSLNNVAAAIHNHIDVSEFDVQRTVTVLEVVTFAHALHDWEPILDAWSCLALDRSMLLALSYSAKLGQHLLKAVWQFYDLPEVVKVGLLRTLCNYASAEHGATTLYDVRRVHQYVGLAGMGLSYSGHELVMELSACLLHNIVIAMVTLTKTSLDREIKHHGESHVAVRIISIALFFIADPHVSEQVRHLLLLALFQLSSASAEITALMSVHPLRCSDATLLALVKSAECCFLVQMLRTVEDLCSSESSSHESSEDMEEDVEEPEYPLDSFVEPPNVVVTEDDDRGSCNNEADEHCPDVNGSTLR